MTVDTTWGNAVTLKVESELDNAHDLTTTELSRLQVYTLSVMVAEVRRESEHTIHVRESTDVLTEPIVPRTRRERERFEEMQRDREHEPAAD